MRIRFKKLLFQLLGFELVVKEIFEFFKRGINGLNAKIRKKLMALAIKAIIVMLFIMLFNIALCFALIALALYFNEMLGSSYQGFFVVSAGCLVLLLLLFIILKNIYWRGRKDL